MKMTIIALFMTFLMAKCQLESVQDISPEMVKLEGKWKLAKIGYGFPAPNGPSEYKPSYEEVLDFNFSSKAYTRIIDGKMTASSGITISKLTDGGTISRDIIIYEKDSTYSFYSFSQNPIFLVLYQAAPIGSVLADGNSYFYEKVK